MDVSLDMTIGHSIVRRDRAHDEGIPTQWE